MLETDRWIVVGSFILALLIIWRVDRFARRRLEILTKNTQVKNGDAEVALMERRTEAEIVQRTLDEVVELRKAELRRKTAAANAAAALDDELKEDRLRTERTILAARAKAYETQADAFAAAEHAAGLETHEESLVDQYAALISAERNASIPRTTFTAFLELMGDRAH